jgi:hypothetical protein
LYNRNNLLVDLLDRSARIDHVHSLRLGVGDREKALAHSFMKGDGFCFEVINRLGRVSSFTSSAETFFNRQIQQNR